MYIEIKWTELSPVSIYQHLCGDFQVTWHSIKYRVDDNYIKLWRMYNERVWPARKPRNVLFKCMSTFAMQKAGIGFLLAGKKSTELVSISKS